MQTTSLRYFIILLLAFGISVAAQSVKADDPTTKALSGSTRLLFKAINENNLESARAAVSQGANVNAESSLGIRPVDLAVDLGHFDLAHFLLAANQIPEIDKEGILLPPPHVPLPVEGNSRPDIPLFFSGRQVSVPTVNSASLPVISAPNFSAPKIFAPKISAPALRPLILPPAIDLPPIQAPQISVPPKISAPKIIAPSFSAPIFSPSKIRAPVSSATRPPVVNIPLEKILPGPPEMPLASYPLAAPGIIAPPEPPPLLTKDGAIVQIPKPLTLSKPPMKTTPSTEATTQPSEAPKPNEEGFMSDVWQSMTGWIPFMGDDDTDNGTPKKKSKAFTLDPFVPSTKNKKAAEPVINFEGASSKKIIK